MRNPKLLTLLRDECELRFPLGFFLKGIPDRNFIETGYRSLDGSDAVSLGIYYTMNEQGLTSALEAADDFAESFGDSLAIAAQEREEEMP